MKYLSIDIETTGINHLSDQILSIGVIVEDTNNKLSFEDIPKFYGIIKHKEIYGNLVAIDMNRDLISSIVKHNKDGVGDNFYNQSEIAGAIKAFVEANGFDGSVNVAGKNFGTFDKLFLEQLENRDIKFSSRIIDPAILYTDWLNDNCLPNLSECKDRSGLDKFVSHNALDDARDVITLLRNKYYGHTPCYK